MRRVSARRSLLALALVAAAGTAGSGCGGDDDEEKTPTTARGPVKTAPDAQIQGADGAKMAASARELLEATDGSGPCFAIVASSYVEKVGETECARKMGAIATGPYDTITRAERVASEVGEAEVASADGSQKQVITFARTFDGDWNINGVKPPG